MQDALLNRTLRLTIIGTIFCLALACLILTYLTIFDLFARQWSEAAGRFVWSAASASGALLLIYYRGDLIDD